MQDKTDIANQPEVYRRDYAQMSRRLDAQVTSANETSNILNVVTFGIAVLYAELRSIRRILVGDK